jgi:hypothetical protein
VSNHIYPAAKVLWLTSGMDVTAIDIKAVLLRGYTYSDAHDNLNDIGAGLRVATSGNMGGVTLTGTVTVSSGGCSVTGPAVDCNDFTWTAVAAGAACESIVWYHDSGVEGTSTLILYVDTLSGLPVTPNGQDIDMVIDSGNGRLFVL